MTSKIIGLGKKKMTKIFVERLLKIPDRNNVFAFYSMISIADMNEVYAEHARPGGWNGTLTI